MNRNRTIKEITRILNLIGNNDKELVNKNILKITEIPGLPGNLKSIFEEVIIENQKDK